MAKSGKSGLQSPGIMDPGLGSGQDGFNITDRVTSYAEGTPSDHRVGRDNVDAPIDPRGRKGSK